MAEYTTVFGSLDDYEKGRVDVIDDDPKALRLLERVRGRRDVASRTRRSRSARTWSTCSR